MAPAGYSVGALASALGKGASDDPSFKKPKIAVSTRPPMNQQWSAVVSGQRSSSTTTASSSTATSVVAPAQPLTPSPPQGLTTTPTTTDASFPSTVTKNTNYHGSSIPLSPFMAPQVSPVARLEDGGGAGNVSQDQGPSVSRSRELGHQIINGVLASSIGPGTEGGTDQQTGHHTNNPNKNSEAYEFHKAAMVRNNRDKNKGSFNNNDHGFPGQHQYQHQHPQQRHNDGWRPQMNQYQYHQHHHQPPDDDHGYFRQPQDHLAQSSGSFPSSSHGTSGPGSNESHRPNFPHEQFHPPHQSNYHSSYTEQQNRQHEGFWQHNGKQQQESSMHHNQHHNNQHHNQHQRQQWYGNRRDQIQFRPPYPTHDLRCKASATNQQAENQYRSNTAPNTQSATTTTMSSTESPYPQNSRHQQQACSYSDNTGSDWPDVESSLRGPHDIEQSRGQSNSVPDVQQCGGRSKYEQEQTECPSAILKNSATDRSNETLSASQTVSYQTAGYNALGPYVEDSTGTTTGPVYATSSPRSQGGEMATTTLAPYPYQDFATGMFPSTMWAAPFPMADVSVYQGSGGYPKVFGPFPAAYSDAAVRQQGQNPQQTAYVCQAAAGMASLPQRTVAMPGHGFSIASSGSVESDGTVQEGIPAGVYNFTSERGPYVFASAPQGGYYCYFQQPASGSYSQVVDEGGYASYEQQQQLSIAPTQGVSLSASGYETTESSECEVQQQQQKGPTVPVPGQPVQDRSEYQHNRQQRQPEQPRRLQPQPRQQQLQPRQQESLSVTSSTRNGSAPEIQDHGDSVANKQPIPGRLDLQQQRGGAPISADLKEQQHPKGLRKPSAAIYEVNNKRGADGPGMGRRDSQTDYRRRGQAQQQQRNHPFVNVGGRDQMINHPNRNLNSNNSRDGLLCGLQQHDPRRPSYESQHPASLIHARQQQEQHRGPGRQKPTWQTAQRRSNEQLFVVREHLHDPLPIGTYDSSHLRYVEAVRRASLDSPEAYGPLSASSVPPFANSGRVTETSQNHQERPRQNRTTEAPNIGEKQRPETTKPLRSDATAYNQQAHPNVNKRLYQQRFSDTIGYCRHFVAGRCTYGEECKFKHPCEVVSETPRQQYQPKKDNQQTTPVTTVPVTQSPHQKPQPEAKNMVPGVPSKGNANVAVSVSVSKGRSAIDSPKKPEGLPVQKAEGLPVQKAEGLPVQKAEGLLVQKPECLPGQQQVQTVGSSTGELNKTTKSVGSPVKKEAPVMHEVRHGRAAGPNRGYDNDPYYSNRRPYYGRRGSPYYHQYQYRQTRQQYQPAKQSSNQPSAGDKTEMRQEGVDNNRTTAGNNRSIGPHMHAAAVPQQQPDAAAPVPEVSSTIQYKGRGGRKRGPASRPGARKVNNEDKRPSNNNSNTGYRNQDQLVATIHERGPGEVQNEKQGFKARKRKTPMASATSSNKEQSPSKQSGAVPQQSADSRPLKEQETGGKPILQSGEQGVATKPEAPSVGAKSVDEKPGVIGTGLHVPNGSTAPEELKVKEKNANGGPVSQQGGRTQQSNNKRRKKNRHKPRYSTEQTNVSGNQSSITDGSAALPKSPSAKSNVPIHVPTSHARITPEAKAAMTRTIDDALKPSSRFHYQSHRGADMNGGEAVGQGQPPKNRDAGTVMNEGQPAVSSAAKCEAPLDRPEREESKQRQTQQPSESSQAGPEQARGPQIGGNTAPDGTAVVRPPHGRSQRGRGRGGRGQDARHRGYGHKNPLLRV